MEGLTDSELFDQIFGICGASLSATSSCGRRRGAVNGRRPDLIRAVAT